MRGIAGGIADGLAVNGGIRTDAGSVGIGRSSRTRYEEFYDRAVSSIAEGIEVQEFCDLCFEYFQWDIMVVDEGYSLLGCAGVRPYEDPYWEALATAGAPEEKTIVDYYLNDGYLQAISGSHEGIYVDWGICTGYPQTSAPIYVHGQLTGFVSLLFMDAERKDEALELNRILARLMSIHFQTSDAFRQQMQNPVRGVFARQLLDTVNYPTAPNPEEYRPFLDVKPGYFIAVVRSVSGNEMVLQHICGRIRALYPEVIYMQIGTALYLFFYDVPGNSEERIRERSYAFLNEYELKIGYSEVFTNLEDRALYIQQAELALKTGERVHGDRRSYYYPDYYIAAAQLEATRSIDLQNLIPSEIVRLREYDEVSRTDYANSLQAYLYERNNLNRAAARLHLHRNSLKYRLDKITDLIDVSVDDPAVAQRLQIGFLILRLIENEE